MAKELVGFVGTGHMGVGGRAVGCGLGHKKSRWVAQRADRGAPAVPRGTRAGFTQNFTF